MKIYVSHSRNYDYENELYLPLRNSELNSQHKFILPHENSTEPFSTKELFQSHGCDLVIAEVSFPATGQGIELGWANLLGIPVICISKKDSKISGSLKVITDKFVEYENTNDLFEILSVQLASL
jgi:nucleoside 2-deoxyribosyltransferase